MVVEQEMAEIYPPDSGRPLRIPARNRLHKMRIPELYGVFAAES